MGNDKYDMLLGGYKILLLEGVFVLEGVFEQAFFCKTENTQKTKKKVPPIYGNFGKTIS